MGTCPLTFPLLRRTSYAAPTRMLTSADPARRWLAIVRRWSPSASAARRSSTTATTFVGKPSWEASPTPSPTPASSPLTSALCSARARAPSAGWPCPETRQDIAVTDEALRQAFPDEPLLQRWLELAPERVKFQGLPARICWLGLGQRDKAGLIFNDLVASGAVKAPIVIGRDHLDSGSVASPYRETEDMADGSDAIADWPILNALLNTASGAAWVAVHHGGGVGMGKSIHAGAQVVADGTPAAAERIRRVLWNDPGTGVMRHADAGYDIARRSAEAHGLDLPMTR